MCTFLLTVAVSDGHTGEQWLEARKASSTNMHVLKPMAISVDLFQCMIASSDLPKYVNILCVILT